MLLAVNMCKYITSGGISYQEMSGRRIDTEDECIHILDTEDLVVQSVKVQELHNLMSNLPIPIDNLCYMLNGAILTCNGGLDLTNQTTRIESLNGSVIYERTEGNDPSFIINNVQYRIRFFAYQGVYTTTHRYAFSLNGISLFDFQMRMQFTRQHSGVAYYYRLNDYLVVQYALVNTCPYRITLVFSLSGEFIDAFTNVDWFGESRYESKDKLFRVKWETAMGGRY